MTTLDIAVEYRNLINSEIDTLVSRLGQGKIHGVAYDTAWSARLAAYYPEYDFEASIEWLRRNQNEDGSWGGGLKHYHDRFISTLAAIIALRESGNNPRDKRRIQRGENALWKLVGGLGRDDSDTIGFPVLAASLGAEAETLGLDVPHAPVRYAAAYKRKVEALFQQPARNWLSSTLTFSFEGLRGGAREDDTILAANHSVSVSLSATAAYLMIKRDDRTLAYMQDTMQRDGTGALPALHPSDLFEIAWPLNNFAAVGALEPDDPRVRPLLDKLWSAWSSEYGSSHSSQWPVTDMDDTAGCYTALFWGNYPVSEDVFNYFEKDDYFCCYLGETNPSLSAHVRLISALRLGEGDHRNQARIKKAIDVLHRNDDNGSFWWDKWHASPYYVTSAALVALNGIGDDLAYSRFKWILRTQNEDGGWGYLGRSTPEETAYCILALLWWDRRRGRIDAKRIDAGVDYLFKHLADKQYAPLWIGKSLYTPYYAVKAAILSALFDYLQWSE